MYIMIVSKYRVVTRYKAHLWNAYERIRLLCEESFRLSKKFHLCALEIRFE